MSISHTHTHTPSRTRLVIRVSLVHFHPPTMLCAFVHMPAKAAAQNQMLHLELRHFARYALMSKKTSAVVQHQQQQQLNRQQQRTSLQQQRQQQKHQQRRRNHLLLGTAQELLLWVRDKSKPHYIPVHTHIHMYVCRYQPNNLVVSSVDNVVRRTT